MSVTASVFRMSLMESVMVHLIHAAVPQSKGPQAAIAHESRTLALQAFGSPERTSLTGATPRIFSGRNHDDPSGMIDSFAKDDAVGMATASA